MSATKTALSVILYGSLVQLAACGEPSAPGASDLAFEPGSTTVELGGAITVRLHNRDVETAGPLSLTVTSPRLTGSGTVAGIDLSVTPATISGIPSGSAREVEIRLTQFSTLPPGSYRATIEVSSRPGQVDATLRVAFYVHEAQSSPATLRITTIPETVLRQGDVFHWGAEARDIAGRLLNIPLAWKLLPEGSGLITDAGSFVGYTTNEASVLVTDGRLADTLDFDLKSRGLGSSTFSMVSTGSLTAHFTSDFWINGDIALVGAWGNGREIRGDRLTVWSVSSPESPVQTDEIVLDAGILNDVKIRDDGMLAVVTHEGSSDGLNGITILDMTTPRHPRVVTRFTEGLEAGVHNVWIEGDYIYAATDGVGEGMIVIDISDPSNPKAVSSFYGGVSVLHDIYVRNGLAFLSHWGAGLIILDVGNGMLGGSPENPVEVGRVITDGGETHNAWYWPETGYVFVGEEDFRRPGRVHVVDASDLSHPREVVSFSVRSGGRGDPPHNFWLDESRGILYAAWHSEGVRAVDVTGELLGRLEMQGRELAEVMFGSGFGCAPSNGACAWAPQLHRGKLFVSEMNSGIWVFDPPR